MLAQYGCLNFHVKRDGRPKLRLTIKNKWSSRWTKSWFYCQVPSLQSSTGGKSIYVLHLWMSVIDYTVEPEVECPDDDMNDVAFVRATNTIEGRDAVEEFLACKMYPLVAGFGFHGMSIGTTPVSKVQITLLLFPIEVVPVGDVSRVLAEMEMVAERFFCGFGTKEYDALSSVKLLNGGILNHVFEQMGVPYGPRPLPGNKASQTVIKKWKAEGSKNQFAKRAKTVPSQVTPSKVAPPKKITILKVVWLKAKPGLRGTSEIELALAKVIGVSKKFCLPDASDPSHVSRNKDHAATNIAERGARVLAFNNLGDDSSPDVHGVPSPKETKEMAPPPLPFVPGRHLR
jgi:hypothetical protein